MKTIFLVQTDKYGGQFFDTKEHAQEFVDAMFYKGVRKLKIKKIEYD